MTGAENCRKGDKRMKQAEHSPVTAGASIAAGYSLARIDRMCSKEEMGERSGSLEQTLDVIGAYFDSEVEVLTVRLFAVMDPVITIVLAVNAVMLLLAVRLPMFSLYGGIA